MDYRFQSKRKTLSFAPYPAVSLKDARARREEAKKQLAAGVDPSAEKKRRDGKGMNTIPTLGGMFESTPYTVRDRW